MTAEAQTVHPTLLQPVLKLVAQQRWIWYVKERVHCSRKQD